MAAKKHVEVGDIVLWRPRHDDWLPMSDYNADEAETIRIPAIVTRVYDNGLWVNLSAYLDRQSSPYFREKVTSDVTVDCNTGHWFFK